MLEEILKSIIDVINNVEDKNKKHSLLSNLWSKYYKLSYENNIILEEANYIYMMSENESYILDVEPEYSEVDENRVITALNKLKEVLEKSSSVSTYGISEDDSFILLKWIIYNTRKNFKSLGVNIVTNSLNGYCELGQIMTILPFEKLGLSVTKNTAKNSLLYDLNHCFGTVSIPTEINGEVILKTYVIDPTYRQFFATVRCNEGRYYTKEENTGMQAKPDPGYFIEDIDFAKELMYKGYFELNEKNANSYGKPFYLSTLKKDDFENKKEVKIDYLFNIINDKNSDYAIREDELEGLNINFPTNKSLNK